MTSSGTPASASASSPIDNRFLGKIISIAQNVPGNDRGQYRVGNLLAKGTFCSVYECAINGGAHNDPPTPRTEKQPMETDGACSLVSNPSGHDFAPIIKVFDNTRQFRRTVMSLHALDGYCRNEGRDEHRKHIEEIIDIGSFTLFDAVAQSFSTLPYVIMPRYEVRLKDYLSTHVTEFGAGLPALVTLTIAKQLFEALDCLQNSGVVHGDIKPGNIMIRGVPAFDSFNVKSFDIVLCDFGSSHLVDPATQKCAPACIGTTSFIAPEIMLGLPYSSASDVWSAMVTIFTIITGDTLFDIYNEDELDYGIDMNGISVADPSETEKNSHSCCPSSADDESMATESRSDISQSDGSRDVADDIDFPTFYSHIVLMYRLLGKPPESFCELAPIYYNNGVPRYTPAITPGSILLFFGSNYLNLNRRQMLQIEEFLRLGLQYMESDRSSASAILAHPFLHPPPVAE